MATKFVPILLSLEKPIKVVKLKIRQGVLVPQGQILFLYNDSSGENKEIKKFKTKHAGIVSTIKVKEGDVVEPGQCLLELEECRHSTVMKDMCAECGTDLRNDEGSNTNRDKAVVPMVHSVPELKVSEELAKKLGQVDADRLLKDRKLVLLVDLDLTLVHSTDENIPTNLKGVSHFFLRNPENNVGKWCHTRVRPKTEVFLESASQIYELHVCTFGTRQYAHAVVELLDPQKKYFSHRILSRDECFDPRTKAANLKALFPCGDNMVCIIDDREDVWRHASNLIHVKPYIFFQSTGDINAPPPLPEETSKLISGKNGAQLSKSTPLPQLDEEPEILKSPIVHNKQKDETSEEKASIEESVSTAEEVNIEQKEQEQMMVKEKDIVPEDQNEVENEQYSEERIDRNVRWVETSDGQLEIEDSDDYLIYLEEILKRVHNHFYELYDKNDGREVPDLKKVIPEVKSKVLNGTSIVFSGLVPTHQKLEISRAYIVATSLGAEVTQDFTEKTTHLVAVRSGTAKVNAGRRIADSKESKLHVVTPDWLWACAERWEHVDERLFPLQRGGQINSRRPPAHCGSPPRPPAQSTAAPRLRTPSGSFIDSINPLLALSSDDLADMGREVEDIFNESGESSSDEEKVGDDDLDDEENPPEDRLITVDTEENTQDSSEDMLVAAESNESDLETECQSAKRPRPSSVTDDEEPPDDDDSWNLMGAKLERDFLAQD